MTRVTAMLATATGDLALLNELARSPGIQLQVLFSYVDNSGRGRHGPIEFEHAFLPQRFTIRTDVQKGTRWTVNQDLGRSIEATEPDVLLVGGYGSPAGFGSIVVAERRRTPWVLFSENQASPGRPRSHAKTALIRPIIRRAAGFVVLGAGGEQFVRSMGGQAPVTIIASNRDLVAIAERADAARLRIPRRDAVRFVCVSRLVEQKGIDVLLDAFTSLAKRFERAELDLVGAGHLEARVRELSAEDPSLRWLGPVAFDEIPDVLGSADVFVLPSRSETWGHVVPEAMAGGLPVIGSIGAGSVPFLLTSDLGWRIQPGDVASLERAMEEALEADLHSMGMKARESVMRFDAREAAEDIASLLHRVSRIRG
jgi:glycosyltransferase involved in cell wall biosynthesis